MQGEGRSALKALERSVISLQVNSNLLNCWRSRYYITGYIPPGIGSQLRHGARIEPAPYNLRNCKGSVTLRLTEIELAQQQDQPNQKTPIDQHNSDLATIFQLECPSVRRSGAFASFTALFLNTRGISQSDKFATTSKSAAE
jgi:hypothetical protein